MEATLCLSEVNGGGPISQHYYDCDIALTQAEEASFLLDGETLLAENDQFAVKASAFDQETGSFALYCENRTAQPLLFRLYQTHDEVMDEIPVTSVKPGKHLYIRTKVESGSLLNAITTSAELPITLEVRELELSEENGIEAYIEGDVLYSDTVMLPGYNF